MVRGSLTSGTETHKADAIIKENISVSNIQKAPVFILLVVYQVQWTWFRVINIPAYFGLE
jgi:hypothetical protein